MTEDDRLSFAPVFIINLRSVFGGDRVHVSFSFFVFGSCLRSRRIRRRGFSGQGGHRKSGNGHKSGSVDQKSSTGDVTIVSVFFSNGDVWHCNSPFLLMVQFRPRFISDRNQARRSVSSIQTSIRLAVATSRCSSQTLCASRRRAANVLLSSANSAIMSKGSTYSASLSSTRWLRKIWPIDRSVSPPILRTRSAIGSVIANS